MLYVDAPLHGPDAPSAPSPPTDTGQLHRGLDYDPGPTRPFLPILRAVFAHPGLDARDLQGVPAPSDNAARNLQSEDAHESEEERRHLPLVPEDGVDERGAAGAASCADGCADLAGGASTAVSAVFPVARD